MVFINTPSVQIELIEPDENPSIMREFLDVHGDGIHHPAFNVERIQRCRPELEDYGYPVLQTGEFTSSAGRYAYIDSLKKCKVFVELLEREEPQPTVQLDLAEARERSILGTNAITQIAFVVHDLHAVADAYCELLGVEKPPVIQSGLPEVTRIEYNGQPTEAKAQFMFIKTPLIEIELIQPSETSSSTWLDFLNAEGEGIHHISFEVENLQEKIDILQNRGWRMVQRGYFYSGRGEYACVDTRADFKVMIELLERYE